jgi:hypothetical protein
MRNLAEYFLLLLGVTGFYAPNFGGRLPVFVVLTQLSLLGTPERLKNQIHSYLSPGAFFRPTRLTF